MKDSHFFAMLSRMKYINRWGLMINSREQNDCEHSLEVAYIAHALGIINNTIYEGHLNAERMAVLGMYHDVTEIITGDMPTPVKYYSTEIRNAYKPIPRSCAATSNEHLVRVLVFSNISAIFLSV